MPVTAEQSSLMTQPQRQASPAGDRPAAVVASALVTPRAGKVLVRLFNPRAECIKIRGGAQIATLEQLSSST